MIEGWTRVCPDCRNADSTKVARTCTTPTFQCECGYVWDESGPQPIFFAQEIDVDMTDDEIDDLAVVLHAAMLAAARKAEAACGNTIDEKGNVVDAAGKLLNGKYPSSD